MYKTGSICAMDDTNLPQKTSNKNSDKKNNLPLLPQKPQEPTEKNIPKPTQTHTRNRIKSLCIPLITNCSWEEVSLKLFHNL